MSTPDTLARELAALDDGLAGRPVEPDLADLADLAVALRDERPAPDPAFTRSLDQRVERGFPRTRATRTRRGIKWPRIPLPALGVAASVLVVVGIAVSVPNGSEDSGSSSAGGEAAVGSAPSGSAGDGGSTAAKPSAPRGAPSAAEDAAGAPASAPPSSVVGPPPTPPPADRGGSARAVERSAQVVLATPPRDIDRASGEILDITRDLRGYVLSSTVSSGSDGQFELSFPERRLQAALTRLSRVAKVRERTQSALDITGAVVSVRERLQDARTERRSLLRQLARAVTPNQTE